MDAMIHIGTDKDTAAEVGNIIISILGSGQDQATIQKALDTLINSTKVEGTTIKECTFTADGDD